MSLDMDTFIVTSLKDAAARQRVELGDELLTVNGQDVAELGAAKVIQNLKNVRPLELGFRKPERKVVES